MLAQAVYQTHGFIDFRFERTEIVQLLLERDADPTIANNNELTPLDSAARTGLVEVCTLLLKDSRVKYHLNHKSITPFFMACINGSREICELFIRHGIEITANWVQRRTTPLHIAAFQGHKEVCELLIETGNILLDIYHDYIETEIYNDDIISRNALSFLYCLWAFALPLSRQGFNWLSGTHWSFKGLDFMFFSQTSH